MYEELRSDVDLVTLSACDTALGREVSGEGLWGFTQAFHYAGARSVLASLWSVADTSTAALMQRFYHHLSVGLSTDMALRQAQLDLIEAPLVVPEITGSERPLDARHPFFWAAFQLNGDWQ